MLVINPEECIDCNLCVTECPVDAIVPDDELAADQQDFLALNAKYAQTWPVITEKKSAPEDADSWRHVPDKRTLLEAE